MAKRSTETKNIITIAENLGLYADHYSPGDGTTRWRFFKKTLFSTKPDYFESSGLYTALGRKEARVWLAGFAAGKNYGGLF